MHKSVATRWVKALRSGKYKQATGQLCKKEAEGDGRAVIEREHRAGHCCLGVLCEILKVPYTDGMGALPTEAMLRADMSSMSGKFPQRELKVKGKIVRVSDLASLNDDARWSFKKIANFIEKNYEKL